MGWEGGNNFLLLVSLHFLYNIVARERILWMPTFISSIAGDFITQQGKRETAMIRYVHIWPFLGIYSAATAETGRSAWSLCNK